MPVPHCFDYCSFVVLSEVWEGYASCFVLFPLVFNLYWFGLLLYHEYITTFCIQTEIKVYSVLAKTHPSLIRIKNTKFEIITNGLFKKLEHTNSTI